MMPDWIEVSALKRSEELWKLFRSMAMNVAWSLIRVGRIGVVCNDGADPDRACQYCGLRYRDHPPVGHEKAVLCDGSFISLDASIVTPAKREADYAKQQRYMDEVDARLRALAGEADAEVIDPATKADPYSQYVRFIGRMCELIKTDPDLESDEAEAEREKVEGFWYDFSDVQKRNLLMHLVKLKGGG